MMEVKGIIFDYGGTIDTNSLHWSEVLWAEYVNSKVPVTKEQFRESYVFAERALAKHPYIKPEHNFYDLLNIKLQLELGDLVANGHLALNEDELKALAEQMAKNCDQYVRNILEVARPIIRKLAEHYPLVLVSNFYGNIETILHEYDLEFFQTIVESAVVGVRKPDPKIFQLGVDALNMPASDIAVIGDAFGKDIVPATSIGCKTIWIKGIGWDDDSKTEEQLRREAEVPTITITDFKQLEEILL